MTRLTTTFVPRPTEYAYAYAYACIAVDTANYDDQPDDINNRYPPCPDLYCLTSLGPLTCAWPPAPQSCHL